MQALFGGPAYRIETERLVLKCWHPKYALKLDGAIRESLDSLLPWMPWAKYEPKEPRDRVALLRRFRSDFDRDEDYVYGVFDRSEEEVVGSSGLHKRIGPLGFEIGYWINKHFQRMGFATETARALVKAGFELFDIDRIEIHCDEKNLGSRRVIDKLGFRHECTLPRRQINADGEFQDIMCWTIFRDEYEKSELKNTKTSFFSAALEELGIEKTEQPDV